LEKPFSLVVATHTAGYKALPLVENIHSGYGYLHQDKVTPLLDTRLHELYKTFSSVMATALPAAKQGVCILARKLFSICILARKQFGFSSLPVNSSVFVPQPRICVVFVS
jgi:hypothetical protein